MSFATYLASTNRGRAVAQRRRGDDRRAGPRSTVPGKMSTLEVVCHIADFEPIYADRMKRVLAEEQPRILSGDPDLFQKRLAHDQRDLAEEIDLIEVVRKQMARILKTASESDVHSARGCTASTEHSRWNPAETHRGTHSAPHPVHREKRAALG